MFYKIKLVFIVRWDLNRGLLFDRTPFYIEAGSFSPDGTMSGGVKMGLGLTGKLGRAW